jgi:hypothetical protein
MCDCVMEWTSYIFNALNSVMIFPRLANKSVIEKTQRQMKSAKKFHPAIYRNLFDSELLCHILTGNFIQQMHCK